MDSITILITCYNKDIELDNTLYSIFNQKVSVPFDVLLIDDGSVDCTKVVISKWQEQYDNIKCIDVYKDSDTFRNPGVPRNIGLVYAKGNLILDTPADAIMGPTTIQDLYDEVKDTNFYCCSKIHSISKEVYLCLTQESTADFYQTLEENKTVYQVQTNAPNGIPRKCDIGYDEGDDVIDPVDEVGLLDLVYHLQAVQHLGLRSQLGVQ